jgi:hypothetical protein
MLIIADQGLTVELETFEQRVPIDLGGRPHQGRRRMHRARSQRLLPSHGYMLVFGADPRWDMNNRVSVGGGCGGSR